MSFQIYQYVSNQGEGYRIRLDEDTAAAGGFSVEGSALQPFAKVSKTNGEFGLRPRSLRVSIVSNNRVLYRLLPFATQAALEAAADSGTISIGSDTWTVVSLVPEDL